MLRLRILVFSILTAFILGTIGYCHYPLGDKPVSVWNALYLSAQLFVMQTPQFESPLSWTLAIARWLAIVSTGLLLFNTLLYIYHQERMGLVLRRRKKHAIVCGLGKRGITMAEKLHRSKFLVVAIDKNPEPDVVERLHELGIPLITGDATRKEILQQAKIVQASQLFTFCPFDSINLSIAIVANEMSNKTGKARQCFVHINDAELRNALQTNKNKQHSEKTPNIQFVDAFAQEAISLLAHGLPLDHNGISKDDTRQVHLIILGFGCMGRTIAVKAAQVGQFANRKRMRISVIDRTADVTWSALLFHHQFIAETVDLSFYQQEVLSHETHNQIESWCKEPDTLVNIVICFDNPSLAFDTVFNLKPALDHNHVRVAVRVNEEEVFASLLKGVKIDQSGEQRVRTFGFEKSLDYLINPDLDETEKFAKDIHKAYIKLNLEQNANKPEKLEQIKKNPELQPWEDLPEDLRESNRQQAVHMYFKIRACGYEVKEIHDPRPAIETFDKDLFEALAIMEHDRWVAERKVNNWKYGPSNDKPNKINASIIGWEHLAESVKQYDYDAVSRIPILLNSVGKKMVVKSSANK